MANEHNQHTTVDDEQRRDLLKALGIVGVAAGGLSLEKLRGELAGSSTAGDVQDLSEHTRAIRSSVGESINAGEIASQQAAMASAAAALPAAQSQGLPSAEPRDEFAAVASEGWPVYDHLVEAGFFQSATESLPAFTPESLSQHARAFVGSSGLAAPLTPLGFSDTEAVDLIATVVGNAQQLSDHHWVATDEIDRSQIEYGEFIPTMTQGAAGGSLLWLDALDQHLYQSEVILTDAIHSDATWHGRAMSAGFALMAAGTRGIAGDDTIDLSDHEIGTALATGFAVQAISQGILPQNVFWVTEEMRAERPDNMVERLKVTGGN